MGTLSNRLEKLEHSVAARPWDVEREVRREYNIRRVSDEALAISPLVTVDGFSEPSWVASEFERSIDGKTAFGATTTLSDCGGREADLFEFTDKNTAMAIEDALEMLCLKTGREFESISDVSEWCSGEGRDYRPVCRL